MLFARFGIANGGKWGPMGANEGQWQMGDRQEHFAVVPNYTPLAFNPNGHPKSMPHQAVKLLYIGDTGERRGIMTALEAMASDLRLAEVELDVLGTSSFQPQLESYVQDMGLVSRVRLHG